MKHIQHVGLPLVVTMTTVVKLRPLVICNSKIPTLPTGVGLGEFPLGRGDIGRGHLEGRSILSTAVIHGIGGESHTHLRERRTVRGEIDHPIAVAVETEMARLQRDLASRKRMTVRDQADPKETNS